MRRLPAIQDTRAYQGFTRSSGGACVRLVLSWTLAGGVAGGGIVVGALTITGVVEPGLELLVAPVLFVVGAVLGFLHGAALAVIGRPACLTRRTALRHAAVALLLAIPLLGVGWLVTECIALTAALMTRMRLPWLVLAVAGWIVGLALCAWAAREGWRAVRAAVARWPEGRMGRIGSVVLTLTLAATTLLFVRTRPAILGTGMRVNSLGAVGLAVAATFWVALPTVWAALHLINPDPLRPHMRGGEAGP